ncbi:MAG TPA: hypothetical protein VHI54_08825 [Actinomycetota bacterium]|nr:hypothetical protein [Actinomycetota bacterium]
MELLAHLGPHGGGFASVNLMLPLALAAGVFFLLRRRPEEQDDETNEESALSERYAKGEISEDDDRQRLSAFRDSRR